MFVSSVEGLSPATIIAIYDYIWLLVACMLLFMGNGIFVMAFWIVFWRNRKYNVYFVDFFKENHELVRSCLYIAIVMIVYKLIQKIPCPPCVCSVLHVVSSLLCPPYGVLHVAHNIKPVYQHSLTPNEIYFFGTWILLAIVCYPPPISDVNIKKPIIFKWPYICQIYDL